MSWPAGVRATRLRKRSVKEVVCAQSSQTQFCIIRMARTPAGHDNETSTAEHAVAAVQPDTHQQQDAGDEQPVGQERAFALFVFILGEVLAIGATAQQKKP